VGIHQVEFNPADRTLRFARPGVRLDLGAIGKGYAVDAAVEILREAGVTRALVHGGTSTVYGLGAPADGEAWTIALPRPEIGPEFLAPGAAPGPDQLDAVLARVPLRDASLSVSAAWGRSFESGGRAYGHVMDPRRGGPVEGAVLAAVVGPSATDTDALSTALLVLGAAGQDAIVATGEGVKTLVVERGEGGGGFRIASRGLQVLPAALRPPV
jgi:thiamine biosynthesis lipoprotein